MRWTPRTLSIFFCLLAVFSIGGFVLESSAQESDRTADRFAGKLVRVVAIGGETTGWAVRLDSERQAGGVTIRQVEVDPAPRQVRLESFQDQRVEITGTLTWRRGVERKKYPVVIIETIREL
ncbi:MAG: hypothetical protein A3G20_07900 [Acidobacteria bacterium RIFCSPLOWO2_12_FULL_59_11]|nr:MAG: hypothetical protein A3G20_07900 [Acidobacteria bacterium RIFCSPLOWO2_12_FULL_59_11]